MTPLFLVDVVGLEPTYPKAIAFEAIVYAIPPHVHDGVPSLMLHRTPELLFLTVLKSVFDPFCESFLFLFASALFSLFSA